MSFCFCREKFHVRRPRIDWNPHIFIDCDSYGLNQESMYCIYMRLRQYLLEIESETHSLRSGSEKDSYACWVHCLSYDQFHLISFHIFSQLSTGHPSYGQSQVR